MAHWIQHWAAHDGGRTAIVFEGRESSWTDFEKRVGQLARALAARGVRPGDRVAIHLANHPAYLDAVFALARIGAISLPTNLRLAAPELAWILSDASPCLVLHDGEHAPVVEQACSQSAEAPARWCVPEDFGAWESELATPGRGSPPPIVPVLPEDPMMIMYSSGTTGRPKGALLPHRKALYNALNAEISFGIAPADRCLIVAPLFHSLGLHILSLPVIRGGGVLVLHRRFDAEAVLAAIARDRITYMGGVPTHYARLLEALEQRADADADADLGSLRFLFGAGAAIDPATVRAFDEHGIVLKQGYGQTETSMLCCLEPRDALHKAGSVGRPLPHLTLRVITQDSLEGPVDGWRDVIPSDPGKATSAGDEVGEIVVRGPITMLGYWQNPEATAETLREGWVRTGDLARIDAEGFITLVGRSKEMFISGGENVYPAEVEAAYLEHPEILEIAVVGVPDPAWGEIGRAWVVSRNGRELEADALTAWGLERLARFKLPREFVFVEELPRTGSGKVQKFRLAKG